MQLSSPFCWGSKTNGAETWERPRTGIWLESPPRFILRVRQGSWSLDQAKVCRAREPLTDKFLQDFYLFCLVTVYCKEQREVMLNKQGLYSPINYKLRIKVHLLKPEVEECFKGLWKLSCFETWRSQGLRNMEEALCTCPKVVDVLIWRIVCTLWSLRERKSGDYGKQMTYLPFLFPCINSLSPIPLLFL